jgi:hypothetical protein
MFMQRKLPQMVLSNSMVNSASVLGDDEDALGYVFLMFMNAKYILLNLEVQIKSVYMLQKSFVVNGVNFAMN